MPKRTETPKDEPAAGAGDNSTVSGREEYDVAAGELRSFLERVEQLEVEKAELAEGIKQVFKEAGGRGYDGKTMRKILRLRRMTPEQRQEEDALLGTYKSALGM